MKKVTVDNFDGDYARGKLHGPDHLPLQTPCNTAINVGVANCSSTPSYGIRLARCPDSGQELTHMLTIGRSYTLYVLKAHAYANTPLSAAFTRHQEKE